MIEDTGFGQGVVFNSGEGVGTEGDCMCVTSGSCGCSSCDGQAALDNDQNALLSFDRFAGL